MKKQWLQDPLPLQHVTLPSRIIIEMENSTSIGGNHLPPFPVGYLAAGNIDSSPSERWKHVIQSVHKEGGYIFLKLEIEKDHFYSASRETALHDIHRMVQSFADQAANAEQAGFDGVEIEGIKESVIHSFVSSETNNRSGSWGGSRKGRLHFPLAVGRHVREYTGPGFPLIFRLPSVTEAVPLEELAMMAGQLEASGVDLFHIGRGPDNSHSTESSFQNIVQTAAAVKKSVSVPVIAATGCVSADTSYRMQEEHGFDGISIHAGNDSWKRLFLSET
ncbi:hypothetical protein [Salibacterium halotolerans]|uniref:2,4-dienoyl-CoA reductase n=1 Tax=Salibacterium halotolerans TaxID=1884432 RepID=A0A1I5U141_9BACI|nr:hypothetical protein [Salibacterium halotolerans]SFP89018.1 2,4-dienoyl-CoA reductase [Salibacterium halotolerans]